MENGKWIVLVWFLILVPFFGTSQSVERVCFSVNGGFYEDAPTLELSPFYTQHHIRFTTNGNRPTAQSRLYTEPLLLDERLYSTSDIYTIVNCPEYQFFLPDSISHCIVIRAAVFDENDNCISEVNTQSYFIQNLGCHTHGLPAISLCADSLDLFDFQTGIFVPGVYWNPQDSLWTGNYYQRGDAWERVANVEFYEADNTGVNQQCGLRTHGGNARRFQQKGMKIYARDAYGNNRFEHRFFEEISQSRFKHLVLKPFCSSWNQAGIANHLSNRIAHNLNVESLADRPATVFLNGEYWGVYYLQEKPDERYLQGHFGLDPDEVNIMGNWINVVDAGTGEHFIQLREWLQTADLSDMAQWDEVKARVDVDCFIDYEILELFIENLDWPTNNMRCWQHQDGPWRWFFFDGDACFNYMAFDVFANAVYDGPDIWPASSNSTLFFRKFLENPAFRTQFKDRFDELMDGVFQSSQTVPYLTDIQTKLEPEIPWQIARFNIPVSQDRWNQDIGINQWFLLKRVENMRARFSDFWPHWDLLGENTDHVACALFPNPCHDRLTLRLNLPAPMKTQLRIFNLLGQEVHSQPLQLESGYNEVEIHLSLAPGIYLLKTDLFTQKLICK